MRLLVTRPEPDATRQAETLAARGHESVIAPLLLIEPATGVGLELDGAQADRHEPQCAPRASIPPRSGAAASAPCRRRSNREGRDRARLHQSDHWPRNWRRIVAPDRRHARSKGRRTRASFRRDGRLRLEIGAASQRLHPQATCALSGGSGDEASRKRSFLAERRQARRRCPDVATDRGHLRRPGGTARRGNASLAT